MHLHLIELIQTDTVILALLMTGILATAVAIVADYAPERRARRDVAERTRGARLP